MTQLDKNLLIVESPAKCKTIQGYLGNDFSVIASYGHIRELDKDINIITAQQPNWEPQFKIIKDKKNKVTQLLKAIDKAENIYLATDCDREGEGIAHSIYEVGKKHLQNKNVKRIIFQEITKAALVKAINNPTEIDYALIYAYKARCVIDLLVGFTISPIIWQNIRRNLSAGRVQSPALKMIIERESEREKFLPQEFWLIDANSCIGKLQLKIFNTKNVQKFTFTDSKSAKAAQAIILKDCATLTIDKIQHKLITYKAPIPFDTATLQSVAAKTLNLSVKNVMKLAQELYEGIKLPSGFTGLISYCRTDSNSLSTQATENIATVISNMFGKRYLSSKNYKKNNIANKEAHEAIRPTNANIIPDSIKSYLSVVQYRLYDLIWRRTIASQMISSIYKHMLVYYVSNNKKHSFLFSTGNIEEIGYKKIYSVYEDDALETTSQQNFHEKQIINIQSCNTKQCFTQPPAKLNESTLVKKLKELGIGRPSTYAYIIETLRNRKYVTIEKQIFSSTEIGKKIVSFLQDNFSLYIDYNFTSKMETELDKIANNQLEAMNFINDFSKTLYDNILAFSLLDENKNCKNCGAEIELRIGRFGPFCCCKNYPSCKYTIRRKNYNKFNLSSQNDLNNTSTTLCPKCHKGRMILRKSKKNSKNFYACDNFPSCKNIYSGITNKHICPACSGNAIYYKYNEPNLYCFNCGKEFIETTSD